MAVILHLSLKIPLFQYIFSVLIQTRLLSFHLYLVGYVLPFSDSLIVPFLWAFLLYSPWQKIMTHTRALQVHKFLHNGLKLCHTILSLSIGTVFLLLILSTYSTSRKLNWGVPKCRQHWSCDCRGGNKFRGRRRTRWWKYGSRCPYIRLVEVVGRREC